MVLFQISKLLDFYYKDIIVGVFGEIFQDFLSHTTNATFCIIFLPFFLVQKLKEVWIENENILKKHSFKLSDFTLLDQLWMSLYNFLWDSENPMRIRKGVIILSSFFLFG